MNTRSGITTNNNFNFGDIISWVFGSLFLAIGLINIFWGNDAGYGIFIAVLSFIFLPPVTKFFNNVSGLSVHLIVKLILGAFIIWSALGVGELFDKVDLMLKDL